MEPIDTDATATTNDLSVPEILEAFKIIDGVYKQKEIDAAIGLKEEITPHLMAILENLLADPQPYIEDDSLYDHIYAVMLLGHFKESSAHQVIIDLFSLPGDVPDQLFGDICTADLPMILLKTCGGSVESIQKMILNREIDAYSRLSACQALAYAVLEGYIARENALAFFNTLFTGQEAEKTSDFWSLLAMMLLHLYPEESMAVITKAYDDELIFSDEVPFSEFMEAIALGKDKCLENLKEELEQYSLDDIHARMSWWACFHEEEALLPPARVQDGAKSQKAKKKHKKKKRKQAKASKKKNRR